ncbi:MAG: hypothetical protein HKN24_05595 [Acidimicrobiales bacterium]|nr:hypothetical protein [Acidimicrobiales bacterium]
MRFDVDDFVEQCRAALDESEPQLAVRDVVARAVSQPAAIKAALGTPNGWKTEPLHIDDRFTVLHFIWPPTLELFPHEHKMWSTVGIYGGIEDNTLYRRDGDRVVVSGHRRGEAGDVLLLGADAIHSVENPSRQWTAAIHVYGSDFFAHPRLQWDLKTGEPQPFSLANSKALLAATEAHFRSEASGGPGV